jgi:multiple sugar transport system permease protein
MAVAARVNRRAERATTSSLLVRSGIRKVVLFGGLALFTIWTIFPIIWIIETSLKPNKDLYQQATLIPQHVTLLHYHEVVDKTPFFTYFKNSLIVSLSTTAIAMIIGVLSAYAITRLAFRGRAFMARATIITYLVPGTLLFIPVFQIA